MKFASYLLSALGATFVGLLIVGVATSGHEDRAALGQLTATCKAVFADVAQIARCELTARDRYALEQRYRPANPEMVATKVLADMFPDAKEQARRRREGGEVNW